MTTAIPAWTKVTLILDGVVQQVMKVNVQTASLLLENPQIVRCKDEAEAGQTAEEVAL